MAIDVIIVSPEAVPFAKTGGLADVAGALPIALKKLGCRASLFIPFYRQVAERGGLRLDATGIEVAVPLGRRLIKAHVLRSSSSGVPVYFIKRDELYDRCYLYGTPEGDYFDNLERFAFFSRAVLETIKALGLKPDVIHCNDWQTGLIPAYLHDAYKDDHYFLQTASVFTIHNIAYQGIFGSDLFEYTGLGYQLYNPEGVEYWGKINLLKAGIVYSDVINTVSEAYSREIQTPEYGNGLEGLLKKRKNDLYGVVNGVDYDEWNPKTDKYLVANYSPDRVKKKAECKRKILAEFKLKLKPEAPLIGIISRLAAQKGFDILAEAMDELMKLNAGFVILGSGDRKYQLLIEEFAIRYPKKVGVKIGYDNGLAHAIEAGCDFFLMPSKYEPCGLNQIYSLKYGTIPIVRATGGLDDTVRDYKGSAGTGFKFKEYSADALVEKVKEALAVYDDKRAWEALQKRAMFEDFSWEHSAQKYIELYNAAALKRKQTIQKSTKTRQPLP